MNRYMIYMPVGTQGRLIPCGSDGSLTLGEMETLVDGYIEVLDSSLEPEWAREPFSQPPVTSCACGPPYT